MSKALVVVLIFSILGMGMIAYGVMVDSSYSGNSFSNSIEKHLPKIDTVFRYDENHSIHITGNPLYTFRQIGDILDQAIIYEY